MKRTLIIDDDYIDFEIHRKMIAMADYEGEVIHYNNAETALTFLKGLLNNQAQWPEYIYIDLKLPFMDGFQFLENLNNFPSSLIGRSKVVVLSSSCNPDDIEKANSYPIVSKYVEKPLTIDMVLKVFSL